MIPLRYRWTGMVVTLVFMTSFFALEQAEREDTAIYKEFWRQMESTDR